MSHKWDAWNPINWAANDDELRTVMPFVTLGVLNYNRREELQKTLDILTTAVQYPNYEIVLVDNGSSDGSVEMVRANFPAVIICEAGENLGVSARNLLTSKARGKYLFHFDDDTCPGSPAMVLRIVQFMESHPEIDVLSTTYYQPVTGIDETKGWEYFRIGGDATAGFEGIFIVEGGSCFRLETLKAVGGYDPAWPGQEGMELALRFFKQGYHVCHCPWFLTLHFIAPTGRPKGRRAYVNSRQTLWMLAKHWPLYAALPLMLAAIPRRILAMLMHRETAGANAKGILDGFRGMPTYLSQAPKLTPWQMIRLFRFYLFLLRWA